MHLDNGQEAIPALISTALKKSDKKYSYYREHCHALASGVDAGKSKDSSVQCTILFRSGPDTCCLSLVIQSWPNFAGRTLGRAEELVDLCTFT